MESLCKIKIILPFILFFTYCFYYVNQNNKINIKQPSVIKVDIFSIKFWNSWQIQKINGGTLHLLSAYLDDRQFNDSEENSYYTIRIIAMLDSLNPKDLNCIIWNNDRGVEAKAETLWIWRPDWEQAENEYQPYLFSCNTRNSTIPQFVSLVGETGDVTNLLKINYEKVEEKEDFVVCVKGLNFPFEDKSANLIEWIELLSLLGANKIHFYQYSVHPNIKRLLNYYHDHNKVNLTVLDLVGEVSNLPLLQEKYLSENKMGRRFQEVVTYTDCFYRYYNKYKFIVNLDTDEVIVPQNGTWFNLIEEVEERYGARDSFLARNVYFFDQFKENLSDIPEYFHILNHVVRTKNHLPEDQYVKGFHNSQSVLALYNHMPLFCLERNCDNVNFDVGLGQLQHYRSDCVKDLSNCEELKEEFVFDARVLRFKEELIIRVQTVLDELGLNNLANSDDFE